MFEEDDFNAFTWWEKCYKTFWQSQFTNGPNKLECLSLASLSKPGLRFLSGAPLFCKNLALPASISLGLERLARDKHSSLISPLVNYDYNKDL
jgi:hypothetical protein